MADPVRVMLEQGKKKRVVACAFDRVSRELREGPRGGGRSREEIIRHVNGAEMGEFAPKVGVKVTEETIDDPTALGAYRQAVVEGIHDHHVRGEPARSWPLQFLIRRLAWHMLDHAGNWKTAT